MPFFTPFLLIALNVIEPVPFVQYMNKTKNYMLSNLMLANMYTCKNMYKRIAFLKSNLNNVYYIFVYIHMVINNAPLINTTWALPYCYYCTTKFNYTYIYNSLYIHFIYVN